MEAFRLRHLVFSQTLKWVPCNPNGLEIDRYDRVAIALGLFSVSKRLVGLVRFLPPVQPFMLEAEFSELLTPGYPIRKNPDTVEFSRLTVAPFFKAEGPLPAPLSVLLKGLYQWSLVNQVRYAYMVLEKRFWRALRILGFPCDPIGPIKKLPPAGTESVAAILDWEAFRCQNRIKRPAFLDWITTVQSTGASWPTQWRVPGSRPEVLREYSGHGI